ncbi:MAG TPA: glutaredoxin family protein [Usitatibacteraceae bacterium]|nr:glutaredoxin family protein [Usitatibacteraceae bacterium]
MNRLIALFATLGLVCAAAQAQQLYKWVDKDGKISYSDTPPPKEAGNVKQQRYGDNAPSPDDSLPYETRLAQQKNPVTLYASACGEACDGARNLLSVRGIPYAAKNPETDLATFEALKKVAGSAQVPVLVVGDEVLKGFLDSAWHAALTAAGYPKSALRRLPAPAAAAAPAPAKDAPAAK